MFLRNQFGIGSNQTYERVLKLPEVDQGSGLYLTSRVPALYTFRGWTVLVATKFGYLFRPFSIGSEFTFRSIFGRQTQNALC